MEKESYFTLANRKAKIEEWLALSRSIRLHELYNFNIEKAALLVLDMQNFFIEHESHAHVPSAGTIILPVNQLISFMINNGRPVIFTRHITSTKPIDLMRKWWSDTIKEEEKTSEISPYVDSTKGMILVKDQYSAFQNTNLKRLLMELGVEQLIITGVMTHLCCETTARDAFMNNFEVFFVVDGTATYTEALHVGTIRAISHGFGMCVSSEEILSG
ncbi:MAG: isochorismatase family protein [Candidatus Heimdallarchaeaceae archaeon]|jgi:isochorismate hydrolase